MVSVKSNKSPSLGDTLSAGASSGTFVWRVMALAAVVLFFITYMITGDDSSSMGDGLLALEPQTIEEAFPIPNLQEFERCKEITFSRPPPTADQNLRPLLLASYPGSGNNPKTKQHTGDLIGPLMQMLTGGAKVLSWHMSGSRMNHCVPRKKDVVNDVGICTTSHPTVPIHPETQTKQFDPHMILLVRQFRTAWPTHFYEKGIMYHEKEGQISEEEWRSFRDSWFNTTGWKQSFVAWKQMNYYNISAYIPYEHMTDPVKGPEVVKKVAKVLQEAGYTTAPADQLPCIWYHAVKDHFGTLRKFHGYIPAYSTTQRQEMLDAIDDLRKMYPDDAELVSLMNEYYDDTAQNTRIDTTPSVRRKRRI